MILFATKPVDVPAERYPKSAAYKHRWMVEADIQSISIESQMQFESEKWASIGLYWNISITKQLHWGFAHTYYDGPHCSFSIGFVHFNWNHLHCEKCLNET